MSTYIPPKRGTALRFTLSLFARSDNQIKITPTLAAGDVKVSKDNGATANITTLPSEAPASSGILQVDLSGTEMTADLVTVIFRDASGAEWNDVAVHIPTAAQQIDDLATQSSVNTIDDFLDTEIAAIKAKTDNLPTDPADASDIASSFSTVNTKLDTIDDFLDTEVAAIKAKTDNLPSDPADASDIAAAFAALDAKVDTIDNFLDTEVAAILADTNELQTDLSDGGRLDLLIDAIKAKTDGLPSDPADASVIAGRFDTLDTAVADLPTNAELATALGTADDAVLAAINDLPTNAELATALAGADDAMLAAVATVDSNVDAIKAKTDSLTFTVAGQVDSNVQYVNDVQVTGNGQSGSEWGPA